MATLSDAKFAALRSQGLTGTVSDMMIGWLALNGATSPCIPDAWKQVLDIISPPDPNHRTDQWVYWLFINGYGAPNKQINDMLLDFWLSGGLLVPKSSSTASYNLDFSIGFA